MKGFKNITISDIDDYFKGDFEIYSEVYKITPRIEIFDAAKMPYPPNTFDRIFSVSAIEHVAGSGDKEIVREIERVLRPGGIFVLTVPAYTSYIEEWVKKPPFYWKSVKNEAGLTFYQRRYDKASFESRLGDAGLKIEDFIFIAEHPIAKPAIDDNGMFAHNVFYLSKSRHFKLLSKIYKAAKIPLLPYIAHRRLSGRCHYLTANSEDTNIRQAVIKMRKPL